MDIKVTLKDLVRGEVALSVLSTQRTIKGKPVYVISAAARQAKPVIEDYRKGMRGILESNNAKPDENGNLQIKPGDKNFKKANEELEKYDEEVLKGEITLTHMQLLKVDELLESILPQKNQEGKIIREGGAVEPFVLEGIHWLLEEEK